MQPRDKIHRHKNTKLGKEAQMNIFQIKKQDKATEELNEVETVYLRKSSR